MNGRKRRESSPHARSALPPLPPPQVRGAPATTTTAPPHWRTLNRLPHQHQHPQHHLHHRHDVRDDSPPFESPSSPMAIQDESDGEPMVTYRSPQHQHQQLHQHQHQQPRWTPLVKREECLVELAGEEDDEDELEDDDEPWHPSPPVSSPSRAHNIQHGMITGPPPPKKKLFGFEQDGSGTGGGGGVAGWPSSHKTQR